jgi:hypothetical protein
VDKSLSLNRESMCSASACGPNILKDAPEHFVLQAPRVKTERAASVAVKTEAGYKWLAERQSAQ